MCTAVFFPIILTYVYKAYKWKESHKVKAFPLLLPEEDQQACTFNSIL